VFSELLVLNHLVIPYIATAVQSLLGRPEPPFRTGLCFTADVFFSLGSQISAVPRPIAPKLCHMIAIWWQSLAKVGQLGGSPLKILGAKNMQNFGQFFATSDFDREYLRNGLRYQNHNSKSI